jgi:CRP-like cAMP-binding protein
MALVSDRPRMAAARSRTKVNVVTVDRAAFGTLFATLPPLRRVFEQMIAQRSTLPPAAPER